MPLAKPSGGIEELVDETSGKEIVATPVVVDQFKSLTKKYEEFLGTYNRERWTTDHVPEVVLPCDISLFLQSTHDYEDHLDYPMCTGLFISQLIQNSYEAGNNNFEIDVNSLKIIDNLAYNISGTEERMVRIVIKGKVGHDCGSKAEHSTFTIEKAGKYCGFKAENSTFTMKEAGNGCGQYTKHSTFTIEKAGDWCGLWAKNSTFTIGETEDQCGSNAYYSTFKTHNPLQYERFKKYVPEDSGNSLYLLSQNGSILKGGEW